jgi:hypothetical protein
MKMEEFYCTSDNKTATNLYIYGARPTTLFKRLFVSAWNMVEQLLCTAMNDIMLHAQFPSEHKQPTQTYSP